MAKEEWIVTCKITGTCNVFVEAESQDEAMRLADEGDWKDCELIEWSPEDAEKAELNK